jgi:hypothetical protein
VSLLAMVCQSTHRSLILHREQARSFRFLDGPPIWQICLNAAPTNDRPNADEP